MKTETQTTELASINDNDATALAAVARELQPSDLIGLLLQFVKGKWFIKESKEKKREVGAIDTFVVDPVSYAEGWIRWENKKPTAKLYARRVDGWIAPSRDALPDQDESRWPLSAQGTQDPWQRVQFLLLKDLATGELLTWQSTTWGGSGAIGEFLDEWADKFKNHPGECPVVLLQSYDKPHPDLGKVPRRRLKIVGWVPFGEGQSPPGNPTRAAAMQQALLALPKPDAAAPDKVQRGRGDMDDEIPF
jgi:hypothetical protein